MSDRLTIQQRATLFRVEVSNIAWSLVAESPEGTTREWRTLTPQETMDVFDRLLRAVDRNMNS